eukprot:2810908-Prymnesium_polylepis.2
MGTNTHAIAVGVHFPPVEPSFRTRPQVQYPDSLISKDRLRDNSLIVIRSHLGPPRRCVKECCSNVCPSQHLMLMHHTRARRLGRPTTFEGRRTTYNGFSLDSGGLTGPGGQYSWGLKFLPSGRDALGARFLAGNAAGPNGPKGSRAHR